MEDRVPYAEMRSWLLGCYYEYCRGKIRGGETWINGEHEIGFAYYELDGVFERPIERFMLEVLTLIFIGGRLPSGEVMHRKEIAIILAEHSLDELLHELHEEELHELRTDLQLLKLI